MKNQEYPLISTTNKITETVPMYFPVSLTKLFVMSFCTFGLYEIYWFYKNWSLIKQHDDKAENIMPALRALLACFFCYSLFSRIQETAEAQELRISLATGFLTSGWIIFTLLWRLPDPYWMISFLAVFFLLPVQSAVNDINSSASPQHDPNSRFTKLNIATSLIGITVLMLGTI